MTSETTNLSRGAALKKALSGRYLTRAIVAGLVVGTLLNLINQGDALFSGNPIDHGKALLTYLVPFCVATYGAWSALLSAR
jgi:hypothetical protein